MKFNSYSNNKSRVLLITKPLNKTHTSSSNIKKVTPAHLQISLFINRNLLIHKLGIHTQAATILTIIKMTIVNSNNNSTIIIGVVIKNK